MWEGKENIEKNSHRPDFSGHLYRSGSGVIGSTNLLVCTVLAKMNLSIRLKSKTKLRGYNICSKYTDVYRSYKAALLGIKTTPMISALIPELYWQMALKVLAII
jgi:hypothetical protein